MLLLCSCSTTHDLGQPRYLARSQKVHYGKAGVQDKRAPLKRQRIQGAADWLSSLNFKVKSQRGRGKTLSYLPVDVVHWDVHEDGSLCQPFQVNVSVTCCWENKRDEGAWVANESQKGNVWHETGSWVQLRQWQQRYPDHRLLFQQPSNNNILDKYVYFKMLTCQKVLQHSLLLISLNTSTLKKLEQATRMVVLAHTLTKLFYETGMNHRLSTNRASNWWRQPSAGQWSPAQWGRGPRQGSALKPPQPCGVWKTEFPPRLD